MKNEEFNSLATKCGFENYTSMLKSMEAHGITIVEVDPLLTNSKDTLVSKIKQRIESEYRKHPDLDWAEIAARKIYAEIKDEKQLETTQPKDTKDNVKMLGVVEVVRISSFGIPITTLLSDRIYGEHADKSVTISLIEDGHIPVRFAEDVINESKWAELYRENYKKIWNLE